MKIIRTSIPEVIIIEPQIFGDTRGYFFISYIKKEFQEKVINTEFIQDNESKSTYGVLRGLHYQLPPYAQSKLVRVIVGKVLDVAVDIRKGSPTFGQHVTVELSQENKHQLFIPRGFAHGFIVLSKEAIFTYKVDNQYAPGYEGSIRFDDPELGINWLLNSKKILLSEKDEKAPLLKDAKLFDYYADYYKK